MGDDASKRLIGASRVEEPVLAEVGLPLEELIRRSAGDILQRAIEAEEQMSVARYCTKYPKATEKLVQDRDALLAFDNFPAEHWGTCAPPIRSSGRNAAVRPRNTRTKNCVSCTTFLGLAFKLAEKAAKSCRRIRARERMLELLEGTPYSDGIPVTDNPPERQLEPA